MNLSNIGLSGVLAAQYGLSTAANNMSTGPFITGYSRREVIFSALPSGGVQVHGQVRINDIYVTKQLWGANASYQQYQKSNHYYNELQSLTSVGPKSTAGYLGMNAFFDALSSASHDPGKEESRSALLNEADSMVAQMNNRTDALQSQFNTVQSDRSSVVSGANDLAEQLAKINKQIVANPENLALLDTRDALVKDLSALTGARANIMSDGTVNMSLKGGQPLVVGNKAYEMKVTQKDGQQQISIVSGEQEFSVSREDLGGELKGLDDFEYDSLRPNMAAHKQLMQETANRYNEQLAKGYDQNGDPGKPLFEFDVSTGRLKTTGLKPAELAFSSSNDPGEIAGNSDNLVALIKIKDERFELEGYGETSLEGALPMMMNKVGSQARNNELNMDTENARLNAVNDRWLEISGISTDQEALSMSRYFQVSQANLKVLEVANRLFDHTMNAL
ncbi:flagellar hook-associated protein FlgK [Chromobacterium amazonense]|uniref:flagellar hook-associated protein FlgK n=1 Tax=Chromobacterium amazonense TaxID=1382803 RepID=UPI0031F6CC45